MRGICGLACLVSMLALISFLFANLSRPAFAEEFNYKNMYLASVKLNRHYDFDLMVDDYMQAFRPEVWSAAKENEFELQKRRVETLEIMKEDVHDYDLGHPLKIFIKTKLGEYNFSRHAFDLAPFFAGSYYSVQSTPGSSLPGELKMTVSNPEFLDGLPMQEDEAKSFLSQIVVYGSVNRDLDLEIDVVPEKLLSDSEVEGRVVGVTVSDPVLHGRMLLKLPAP